jgi:hypothetical protein
MVTWPVVVPAVPVPIVMPVPVSVVAWLRVTAPVIPGLGVTAPVITRLGVTALVIPRLGVTAAIVPGLGVTAVVISRLGVLTVMSGGGGARGHLHRDALRERGVAHQAGDGGHTRDRGRGRGDKQSLHGFFLPWDLLPVVKPGPRLGPPLASRPSTSRVTALPTRG